MRKFQKRGKTENRKEIDDFLINLPPEKLNYLFTVNPSWCHIIVHLYGLGDYLPITLRAIARLSKVSEIGLWFTKEMALYTLGYPKLYKRTVVANAIPYVRRLEIRSKIAWTYSHLPLWWSRKKRKIADAIIKFGSHNLDQISESTDEDKNSVCRVLATLLQGKLQRGNPTKIERQELFQEILDRNCHKEQFVSLSENITRLVVEKSLQGKSARQIAKELNSHPGYIAAVLRTAQHLCPRLEEYGFKRDKLLANGSSLSDEEKLFLSKRLDGQTYQQIAISLGITLEDAKVIELAFLGLVENSKDRGHNQDLPDPKEFPLPPLTDEQKEVNSLFAAVSWPTKAGKGVYPLTKRQIEDLELLKFHSKVIGGIRLVRFPEQILKNESSNTRWLLSFEKFREAGFLQEASEDGSWIVTNRDYLII